MEIDYRGRVIRLEKELTLYDKLALRFSEILDRHDVEHVYVSGYVALIFGRSRTSEDIDMLVRRMKPDAFAKLWKDIHSSGFYCHNTSDAGKAYDDYLDKQIAIRFSEDGRVIPNVEFKWASTEQHHRALSDTVEIRFLEGGFMISSLETQISFKLLLGSEKDIEDARYLFEIFRDHIDRKSLIGELTYLEIDIGRARRLLGWNDGQEGD